LLRFAKEEVPGGKEHLPNKEEVGISVLERAFRV